MEKSKGSIFIIAHKKFPQILLSNYKTLLVGKKNFCLKNALRDDVGINIATKNKNYCELTGLYWIWKNWNEPSDYIGLVHYRRYFSKSFLFNNVKFYLSDDYIEKKLKKYDCILPRKFRFRKTIGVNYYQNGAGKKKDLMTLKKVIKEKFSEYSVSLDKVLQSHSASYCNMFIMKPKYFNQYCDWLFSVLFEMEKRTSLKGYTKEEARIYGYLGEILLNVWVNHNNIRVKYLPMVVTEESIVRRAINKIKGVA